MFKKLTTEELAAKFDGLPEELQDAILASDLGDKVQGLASKYGLHIDQAGQLQDLVTYTLLGVTSPNDFTTHVKDMFAFDESKSSSLTEDVNDSVFVPLRSSLGSVSEEKPTSQESEIESKDSILAEIENPTPTVHPITVDTGGPAQPKEILPEIAPEHELAASEFVANKLSSPTSAPVEKTTIKLEPTLRNPTGAPPKPKGYTGNTDPYREPLA